MKKIFEEFKEFALKGSMLDLAIGVIIGAAFNAVVSSIVNDILTPIFGMIIGGRDFSGLAITFGEAKIKYGMLIQNMLNFLIVSSCLFVLVKGINKLKKHEEPKEEPAPKKSDDIVLLEEIRDSLVAIQKETK